MVSITVHTLGLFGSEKQTIRNNVVSGSNTTARIRVTMETNVVAQGWMREGIWPTLGDHALFSSVFSPVRNNGDLGRKSRGRAS